MNHHPQEDPQTSDRPLGHGDHWNALGFEAQEFQVSEGPLVDWQREQLRKEGKHAEADGPDFSVTVTTEGLRTLHSLHHDHHQVIARVHGAPPIEVLRDLRGWLLDVAALPDELQTGHRLPLYAFPPALEEGYLPHEGDRLVGTAWLQSD